nr:hypothetical protein [Microbacterium bovistercoris]
MLPADWTEHRRDDGELVGWIRPAGDDWVAVDLLGRDASEPIDWLDAEAVLERRGIGWLADIWMLDRADAPPLRVRMVEVTPDHVVVQTDDFGAIDVPVTRFELPWPAPEGLRPRREDDPDGRAFGARSVAR